MDKLPMSGNKMIRQIVSIVLLIICGVLLGKIISGVIPAKTVVVVTWPEGFDSSGIDISTSGEEDYSSNIEQEAGNVTDNTTEKPDADTGEQIENNRQDGSKILIDSDVLIKGDSVPIRFFDGKEIIAVDPDMHLSCDNDCIEFEKDSVDAYNCVSAKKQGTAVITVSYNGKTARKRIYVHEESDQTNGLYCTQTLIIFGATSEGSGVAEFNVGVEGDVSEKLTAKFYMTDSRLGFTVEGKWLDYHTLQCKIENHLSRAIDGKMRIVVIEKDNPDNLIGVATLVVDTPKL